MCVVRCALFVVCFVCVDCRLSFVVFVRCLRSGVRGCLLGGCCLLCVVCCLSFAALLLFADCGLLYVIFVVCLMFAVSSIVFVVL